MLRIIRDPTKEDLLRFGAAKAAAPYCHPHLTSMAPTDLSSAGSTENRVEVRAREG
jgi:hypothetical protein